MEKQTFEITFTAGPHPTPPIARIKRLLKYAGRALGLRCVGIVPTEPIPKTEPPHGAEPKEPKP